MEPTSSHYAAVKQEKTKLRMSCFPAPADWRRGARRPGRHYGVSAASNCETLLSRLCCQTVEGTRACESRSPRSDGSQQAHPSVAVATVPGGSGGREGEVGWGLASDRWSLRSGEAPARPSCTGGQDVTAAQSESLFGFIS